MSELMSNWDKENEQAQLRFLEWKNKHPGIDFNWDDLSVESRRRWRKKVRGEYYG